MGATCPARLDGLTGAGGGGRVMWGSMRAELAFEVYEGMHHPVKGGESIPNRKECVEAQRYKRGMSHLKEVRGAKGRAYLRQMVGGKAGEAGGTPMAGAFCALLWNLHLLLEVNGDHWKTFI